MTRSTFSFMYRVYKITPGQREKFDHCPRATHPLTSTFNKLYIKGKLSISITIVFLYFCRFDISVSFINIHPVFLTLFCWSVSSYVKWCLVTPFSFLNSRPLGLPVGVRTKHGPGVHGPPLWARSTDRFHGLGPWTPCRGPGPWTLFFK